MSRYAAMFERLAKSGEGAFGAFLMLGDPNLETSARLLDAAVEGGADMIEVGIPFSDPIADGPVIQASAERALKQNVRPADAFSLLADFRRRHPQIPVGILTYANLVMARGRDAFCRASVEAGADSLLVADVPVFEAEPFVAAAARVHFPRELNWLFIGPSGPHIIGKAARACASAMGSPARYNRSTPGGISYGGNASVRGIKVRADIRHQTVTGWS